jgi:tRNA-guanine family transglycosylase
MVNAQEILGSPVWTDRVIKKGIHKALGFSGSVMMDSGGFLLLRGHDTRFGLQEVVDLYEAGRPEYCVSLDYPLKPGIRCGQERVKQRQSLHNLSAIIKMRTTSNPCLIPVIHGRSIESVSWYINRLNQRGRFSLVGIGSLVPSLFKLKRAMGITQAISILSYVRKRMPNTKLHAFGVGSTITMHLMFLIGVNSIDSSAWRTKAAYGAIQLPGTGDRYITSNERQAVKKQLGRAERRLLDECKCPACRREGVAGLRKSFTLRALHNAWVLQQEVNFVRDLKKDDEYENYARGILVKSRYKVPLERNSLMKQEKLR